MTFNPYQDQIDALAEQIAEAQTLLEDPAMQELAQAEIKRLETEKQALETAATTFENAQQSDDEQPGAVPTNCIIEVRGGAGGDEAKIWGGELLRMYIRFAEQHKLKLEYIDDSVIKIKGKLEVALPALEEDQIEITKTLTVYQLLKYETGVHRVQRVPSTESSGRIHTSTASVAVLPEVHPRAVEIKEEDLEWQFMRASGAGGQSVNKTSSAVRLIHNPSGIVVTSRQEKKQEQNRKIALELLRSQLWEIEEEKRQAKIGEARSKIGRNMRSEKIRTYNFPQNRVTDHRIQTSWYNLDGILDGGINEITTTTFRSLEGEEEEVVE